jgi:hypothetical protein
MTEVLSDIAEFELPYRRKAMLRRVDFDSGMSMVRLVIREGTRITQVDLDPETATELGAALVGAAADL